MPWKECSVTDEQVRFLAWVLDGWRVSLLCREWPGALRHQLSIERMLD